jgi:hypothetical protein
VALIPVARTFGQLLCHKMKREELYNLHKTALFILPLFVFKSNKILSDQFSTLRKAVPQNLALFENKNYTIKINRSV